MKKVLLQFLLALFICIMIVGCTKTETTPTVMGDTKVIGDAAPAQYKSEEAFVSAIKNGGESNGWDIKSIKYYYRPKNLPEGAMFSYIEVGQTHIEFAYTFDADKKSDDRTKLMTFRWFRTFKGYSDAFIEVEVRKRNGKEVKLKDGREGTKYVSDYTFSESKALKSKDRPAWYLKWVQDGECFSGWIPYSLSEKDIAKYLEMEKVIVE